MSVRIWMQNIHDEYDQYELFDVCPISCEGKTDEEIEEIVEEVVNDIDVDALDDEDREEFEEVMNNEAYMLQWEWV